MSNCDGSELISSFTHRQAWISEVTSKRFIHSRGRTHARASMERALALTKHAACTLERGERKGAQATDHVAAAPLLSEDDGSLAGGWRSLCRTYVHNGTIRRRRQMLDEIRRRPPSQFPRLVHVDIWLGERESVRRGGEISFVARSAQRCC